MSRRERHPLVVKLKTGEYDGTDLMHAWLLIEALQEENAKLRELLKGIMSDDLIEAHLNGSE